MAYVCEICGKKTVIGSSKQHKRGVAGKRWKKRVTATRRAFRPNLQKKTLVISGETKALRICAKCIKAIKAKGKVKEYSNISIS